MIIFHLPISHLSVIVITYIVFIYCDVYVSFNIQGEFCITFFLTVINIL